MPYENESLYSLYMRHVGESKVPASYHQICFFLMMACAVQDRVIFRKGPESKLAPNLYGMLIGPSVSGKDTAVDAARKFLDPLDGLVVYEGNVSAQGLLKEIMKVVNLPKLEGCVGPPRLAFFAPELAACIGDGPKARAMITFLTQIYTKGGMQQTLSYATLTHGNFDGIAPSLSCLLGSTKEWLRRSVTREDLIAGFGSRVLLAYVNPNPRTMKRYVRPIVPGDYYELRAEITRRVTRLNTLKGEFTQSNEAKEIEERWYLGRPFPQTDEMWPAWERAQDLAIKLAMLLSLSERPDAMRIEARHMSAAQEIVDGMQVRLAGLVDDVGLGEMDQAVSLIKRYLKGDKALGHSELLSKLCGNGMDSRRMGWAMQTLVESGQVLVFDAQGNHLPGQVKGAFYGRVDPAGGMRLPGVELDS